jgi:hypothetical protein
MHDSRRTAAMRGGGAPQFKADTAQMLECESSGPASNWVISPNAWGAEQADLPVQELFNWHMKVRILEI